MTATTKYPWEARKKRRDIFPDMHRLVKPGKLGEAAIDHITVSKEEAKAYNFGAILSGRGSDQVEPGKYARLAVAGELMMTDTPMERRTNTEFVRRANGRVFIAGLGLGMIVHAVLDKPEVEHVTVLEKSKDVIKLVGPTIESKKVTIVHGDVFEWTPPKGEKWDTIYFDIWPTIGTDNLPEMARCSRRFMHRLNRANPKAWMGSWRQKELQARKREENRRGWW